MRNALTDNTYTEMPDRGIVTVSGPDAYAFLQNIVTNDLSHLEKIPMLHACLLTPQGKYLHDFFITKDGGSFLLECEGGVRAQDLAKRLSLYKLRAAVEISAIDKVTIYITQENRSRQKPAGEKISFEEWDHNRILAAQIDGSRDAEIGASTLAELNLDESAVSYTKGCYIGQELVARMHNRNLGKKHLVAALFKSTPPSSGTEIEGYGIMRSSCRNAGLILMNRETEREIKEKQNDDSQIYLLGL